MKIFHDFNECGSIRNAVVTTGTFDGVHIAHRVILRRLRKLADEINGETVLITFHPHPKKVLFPDTYGKELYLINSDREKIELLNQAGLDNLVIAEFTLEFSRITSVDFVRNILLNKLHTKKIVVGFNHHFGHNREGDYEELRKLGIEWGFDVEEIPEQDIEDEKVSSNKIRKALLEGNIEKANAYLDSRYLIMGYIGEAGTLLKEIGYQGWSVRIEEESKLIPPDGIYAVEVGDNQGLYPGICFIRKQRADSTKALVEFHLPGHPGKPDGDTAKIWFLKYSKLLR